MKIYTEYSKKIPCYGNYDIVVLGGGPSGVAAAIEAARNGAKVLIVEAYGMLGGMATTSLVSPFMTNYDRNGENITVGGIYREIIEKLAERSAAILPENTDSPSIHTSFIEKYHKHVTPFNAFELQILLDEMVQEAGAEILLYTRFADCITENGRIKTVILSALEGLISVSAKVFIDCTGNASVADAAGVHTYIGDEKTGVPQPGTLMFEIGGVNDEIYSARPKQPVKAYRTPIKGRYSVNHYRVFDVNATNSKSMTDAHIKARHQVIDAYRMLKLETPGFEDIELLQVASVLGVRESRHIDGQYKITVDDICRGTYFDDRIAVYGFGMDVHPRNENMFGNFKIEVANRYYIPYRSMIPKGIDNLVVAGKTISCESQAAGGLRCMPCAMAMGQAAGAASAMSVKLNKDVAVIDVKELQRIIISHGAIID